MSEDDLPADLEAYRSRFRDAGFGLAAAAALGARLGLAGAPERSFDGSNLLFSFEGAWLKLYPPAWRESYEVEAQVLAAWTGGLPVALPRLLAHGPLGAWRYLATSPVAGVAYAKLKNSLAPEAVDQLADDVGALRGALARRDRLGLRCAGQLWHEFARARVDGAERIHLARGCPPLWARRIAAFQAETRPLLDRAARLATVHADLNHAHLLLDERTHRLCGLIDFADAVDAPAEVELILPFLDCFRGDHARQRRVIAASGVPAPFAGADFAAGMMALTLLNRFIRFDDWFDREIHLLGDDSVRAVAERVFPSAQ